MFASRRRFTFEALEPRQVLSAHALAQGFAAVQTGFKHDNIPAAVAANLQGNFRASVTALNAVLTDPADGSVIGSARYFSATNRNNTNAFFTATVRGAEADTTYDVAIDGEVVGTITTNEDGNGALVFATKARGSAEAFPENFPDALSAGSIVSVGNAAGELESRFAQHDNVDRVHLIGFMRDPDSSLVGGVKYSSVSEDGVTEAKLEVNVDGAEANAELAVAIDGITVGTVTTDARGRGRLILSSEDGTLPTTVESGAEVTVGSATGRLQALPRLGGHR